MAENAPRSVPSPSSSNMSQTRILSGIVVIGVALLVGLLGGWYFTAAIALLVFLGQQEYFNLVRAKGIAPAAKTTMAVSQILIVISHVAPEFAEPIFAVAGTFICFYLLFRPRLASIADISSSILGLFYCGFLPGYWIRLRDVDGASFQTLPLDGYFPIPWSGFSAMPPGMLAMLLAIASVAAADIGAYFLGKAIGKTKLSNISPKKTVEGALSGFGASVVVAGLGAWALGWVWAPVTGALLGLMVGVTSLLGDLTESIMKRDAGVKDSGQLIPGHGGILDRMDSYIFTAPLVFYFVTIILPLLEKL